MGKKLLLTVAALGAGLYFANKEVKANPDGALAHMLDSFKENPTVQAGKDKVTQTVKSQGQVVTDKVADMVKERLFGADPKNEEIVIDVQAEEVETEVNR